MKRIIFLLLSMMLSAQVFTASSEVQIVLSQQGEHIEHFAPADMPEVYYNSDEEEIIIVADGFSSYYNVLIIRNSTNQTMVSTQIIGYGDSIDISSLPSDNYILVITSEYNNVFQGNFTIM